MQALEPGLQPGGLEWHRTKLQNLASKRGPMGAVGAQGASTGQRPHTARSGGGRSASLTARSVPSTGFSGAWTPGDGPVPRRPQTARLKEARGMHPSSGMTPRPPPPRSHALSPADYMFIELEGAPPPPATPGREEVLALGPASSRVECQDAARKRLRILGGLGNHIAREAAVSELYELVARCHVSKAWLVEQGRGEVLERLAALATAGTRAHKDGAARLLALLADAPPRTRRAVAAAPQVLRTNRTRPSRPPRTNRTRPSRPPRTNRTRPSRGRRAPAGPGRVRAAPPRKHATAARVRGARARAAGGGA